MGDAFFLVYQIPYHEFVFFFPLFFFFVIDDLESAE